MNFIIGIVCGIVGAAVAPISGNWLAALWALAAAGWAASGYFERQKAERLRPKRWPQVGTIRRRENSVDYEVWDGKNWTQV